MYFLLICPPEKYPARRLVISDFQEDKTTVRQSGDQIVACYIGLEGHIAACLKNH